MYENFDKSGKTFHKSFGTEKALPDAAPAKATPEYSPKRSDTSYPGRSTSTVTNSFDAKTETPTFAKAGGKAQVSARYGSRGPQSFPGTTAKSTLKPPMSDKPSAR